jgi:sterol desaturase/sphingolipid hydroxylase (fatty acid hydroxylase superfamily)
MANELMTAILFIVGLIVSTVIIYVVTKLFKQKEGIGRAFLTALIGTVVYSIVYFIFGQGWIAGIVGGIVWLLALRGLYEIGWLKALGIAIIVWIAAIIVGLLLPTVPGPL